MKTRIGHIQFLNSLPLYYMLVKEEIVLKIDMEMSKEHVELIAEEAARWDVFSKDF